MLNMNMARLFGTSVNRFCHFPGFCRQVLTIWAAVSMCGFAIASTDGRADIVPDTAVQTAIGQVADTADRASRQVGLDRLAEAYAAAPEQLVRQLAYFASRGRGMQQSAAVGVILRRLEVPEVVLARALWPCLESADVAVAKTVRNILSGLEERAADRRADFSAYRDIIEERVRAEEAPPMPLIRYMYDADAGLALLTLMRAHQLREPDEIKRILWAEHIVSNMLWKQKYGFLKPNEVDDAAANELRALSTHAAWWARVYVAEVMRQNVSLRQAEVISALQRDANQAVRESAERPASSAAGP